MDIIKQSKNKESRIDVILLCGTHLNKFTTQLVNIPGYTLTSISRLLSKGGRTVILVRSEAPYACRLDLEKFCEKELESTYIEITAKNGKQIILESLYRSLNTDVKLLFNYLEDTISKVNQEKDAKELVYGMDHNLDLLKAHIHTQTQKFLDILLEHNLLPTITRPSQITQQSATLIDNIFESEKLHSNFDSCLILDDMSDHLPCLALLKQTKISDKTPLTFTSRKLNEAKINTIKQDLNQVDWTNLLNRLPCNESFNAFHNKLEEIMDKTAPKETIHMSGKRSFTEPWMMTVLEKSFRKCLKLYKESLLTTSGITAKHRYKEYWNMLNKARCTAMKSYYNSKSIKY